MIDKTDTTAKLDFRAGYYAKQVAPRLMLPAGTESGRATLPPGSKPPVVIFKREPEYSEEARKAKYQGSVTLYLEVDETGKPKNIRVLRSLGLGLDEKAIEAVTQWRFKPGTTNGVPVTMATTVKVDFRLLYNLSGERLPATRAGAQSSGRDSVASTRRQGAMRFRLPGSRAGPGQQDQWIAGKGAVNVTHHTLAARMCRTPAPARILGLLKETTARKVDYRKLATHTPGKAAEPAGLKLRANPFGLPISN